MIFNFLSLKILGKVLVTKPELHYKKISVRFCFVRNCTYLHVPGVLKHQVFKKEVVKV